MLLVLKIITHSLNTNWYAPAQIIFLLLWLIWHFNFNLLQHLKQQIHHMPNSENTLILTDSKWIQNFYILIKYESIIISVELSSWFQIFLLLHRSMHNSFGSQEWLYYRLFHYSMFHYSVFHYRHQRLRFHYIEILLYSGMDPFRNCTSLGDNMVVTWEKSRTTTRTSRPKWNASTCGPKWNR